jgi:type I restriction enzyme S subunit
MVCLFEVGNQISRRYFKLNFGIDMNIRQAQLPKGWEECNLEDYIKLIDYRGRTPVKTESGVRLITAKNVKLGYLQLEPQEFIAANNYNSWMSRGIPNVGDIIFTTEAPLANVAQIDTSEKLAFAQRIIVMQPKVNKIDSTFLKHMLLSETVRKKILEKGTGATVLGIKSSLLKKIRISFPPLPEQQRIVSILDEAFSAIAKAKTNAEQNLKNAKELFESYLQGVFENKGDDWEEKALGEIIDIKNGKNQQAVLSDTGEYKIMGSAGNVMGYATDFICEAGTTIIGRKGNISKPLYINERFWNVDTAFGFYPKNEKEIDKRFIYYLCLGIDFKSMNRGTTIPSLVKSELQTIQICFPKSFKIQQTIVKKLDALIAEVKKLEAIYEQKLKDLDELKKSVLQIAFSGEL